MLLVGSLGLLAPQPLRRIKAIKNVLAVTGNGVAGVVYVFFAPVSWSAIVLLAVGSVAGGPLGAGLARRLPPRELRIGIGLFALVVAVVIAARAW